MSWTEQYSALDRAIHRMAFAHTGIQMAVADIEEVAFRAQLKDLPCKAPVFITSLPRAGATLMLEILSNVPEFATHTYRQMPFLLSPMFWDAISRPFRKSGNRMERAQGDGMEIGFDSAEAFEEVIWRTWWPEKYLDGSIDIWRRTDDMPDFAEFMQSHMRKIVALARQNKRSSASRYLSKNNANIARIDKLIDLFPDCTIIVPVRDPVDQVLSLHRQHMRFLKAHGEDEFAEQYMRDIGHLEFGGNLQPIAFPGFGADAERAQSQQFWLEYWIAGYRGLLGNANPHLHFVSYEELCTNPPAVIGTLLDRLGVSDQIDVSELAAGVSKRTRTQTLDDVNSATLHEAVSVYDAVVEAVHARAA